MKDFSLLVGFGALIRSAFAIQLDGSRKEPRIVAHDLFRGQGTSQGFVEKRDVDLLRLKPWV